MLMGVGLLFSKLFESDSDYDINIHLPVLSKDIILSHILPHCSIKDHLKWKRVCKQWYNYFKTRYLKNKRIWELKLNGDSLLYGIQRCYPSESKYTNTVTWMFGNYTYYHAIQQRDKDIDFSRKLSRTIKSEEREKNDIFEQMERIAKDRRFVIVAVPLPFREQVLDICKIHGYIYVKYMATYQSESEFTVTKQKCRTCMDNEYEK